MPKPKASEPSEPQSFPSTPPPSIGPDMSSWLISAVTKAEGTFGKLEATILAVQTQLNRIETKLSEIEKEVHGHGRWMHTLKAFAVVVLAIFGWLFVNAVWPWLKAKIGVPDSGQAPH